MSHHKALLIVDLTLMNILSNYIDRGVRCLLGEHHDPLILAHIEDYQ